MLITKEIAAKMESCIKQTHIAVTKEYVAGNVLEINGGVACFSGYNSFLSQVVGWGFASKTKHLKKEIETIEHFYKALRHSRVDIELCPYAGSDIAAFLSQRGYVISELNNVSVLDVTHYDLAVINESDWLIKEVAPEELNEWAKRVAAGFGYPEAQEQFVHYARANGSTAFAVYHAEQIIAGAAITIHGDVCDLGVTSTLPAYRGRGLQKQLLMARLNFAKQHGLFLATVTTEPGTISNVNVQKAGFQCAYTRIKMSLESVA